MDARLRELAILQVGWLARSPYEWSHHIKIGQDFGVTDADIEALVAESRGEATALEPLARLVLQAAREIHAGAHRPLHPNPTRCAEVRAEHCPRCRADVTGVAQMAVQAYDRIEPA
ncbi:MAG: carboxymuconolactone decarboxylase family protein, partial [Pseudomonadota bacterium]|nr:carboxymuconolactone decarboxylase family protein [Pseudomonadota bacterium]